MGELEGKVAFVTGAGRREGLGRAIALELARRAADVVVGELLRPGDGFPSESIGKEDELEVVADEIRALGRKALAVQCDVVNAQEVQAALDRTVAELGRVDILVNNAGVGYLMGQVVDLDEKDWDTTIAVNLKGPFLCSKAAARQMIAQGEGGRIIHIASQAAKSAFPFTSPYTASKHGLIGLMRVMALELGPYGITVNAVCPNHVPTGLGRQQNRMLSERLGLDLDEYVASIPKRIPLGRLCTQQDVAQAVAWLAGPAASYVTGESLNVSGGEEMH